MNVSTNRNDQEQLYDVMKQLLPQLEKELKEELQAKYAKIFVEKENIIRRQFEDIYAKKLQKAIQEKEEIMQMQHTKMMDERNKKEERKKEEGKEINQMKQRISQLEKEVQILKQQKVNWTKIEKGYQKALRELNGNQENFSTSNTFDTRIKSITDKDLSKPQSRRESSHTQINTLPSKTKPQLVIQTQNLKQFAERLPLFKTNSMLLYRTDQTQSNYSQVQGILSPPSMDPDLIDSVLEYNANPKPPQKQVFWNQEKKQQLLKMIRLRMN